MASAWAASKKLSLFSVINACKGVFERSRLMLVTMLSGQSNVVRLGCGAVRLKKVYMPRR